MDAKENMKKALQELTNEVPKNNVFDIHHIINQLRKRYSSVYLKYAIESNQGDTKTLHSNISKMVKDLENIKIHDIKSWSENIHNKNSSCALYERV